MVTGSYHLSGLESLTQAIPTLSYLDLRTIGTLAKITGVNECPFINVRVEESFYILQELIRNRSLRREIGSYSRKWILKYYNDREMIKYYEDSYHDLFNNPKNFNKDYIRMDNRKLNDWYSKDLYELAWKSRAKNNQKNLIINKIFILIKRVTIKIVNKWWKVIS